MLSQGTYEDRRDRTADCLPGSTGGNRREDTLSQRLPGDNPYRLKENTDKEVVFFTGVPNGGKEQVQKKEVLAMKWLSLNEAQTVLTFPSDAEVLKKAYRFLEAQGGADLLKEHES